MYVCLKEREREKEKEREGEREMNSIAFFRTDDQSSSLKTYFLSQFKFSKSISFSLIFWPKLCKPKTKVKLMALCLFVNVFGQKIKENEKRF